MTFTNLTPAGLYLTLAGRELAPGERFEVSWLRAKRDRGVRAAMAAGALGWVSAADEPTVPGSRPVPTDAEQNAAASRRKAKAKAEAAAREQARERQEAADNAALSANMARMGNFDVPAGTRQVTKSRTVSQERPVTAADVIASDRPKSLADIRRHNKAVKAVKTLGRSS